MYEVIEEVVSGLCEFVVEVAVDAVTSIFTDWNTEEEEEEEEIL